MKLKIYNFKNPKNGSKPIGEIIINHKVLIRTICIDKSYICNGKQLDSDYRTEYKLDFLDKYNELYKYGKVTIKYAIRPNTILTAFLKPNYLKRTYLKLLFEYYAIQKMKGLKQIFIGIIIGVVSAVVAGLILQLFICSS